MQRAFKSLGIGMTALLLIAGTARAQWNADYWPPWKSIFNGRVRQINTYTGMVEREVTLAFRGRKEMERVTLEPPRRVVHELLAGPMRGTKTVSVTPNGDGTTELSAVYDVRLTGFLKLGTGAFTRHASEGVEHALQRIKEMAEGRPPSV